MGEPRYLQLRDLHKALNADIVKKAALHGGAIPWVKDYTGQLEDPEYVMLTLSERAVLKDLRLLAARRGNKILFDQSYLRAQLRCSTRTDVLRKVSRLRSLGFLEEYASATNPPAKPHNPSHLNLTSGENDVSIEQQQKEQLLTAFKSPFVASYAEHLNGSTSAAEQPASIDIVMAILDELPGSDEESIRQVEPYTAQLSLRDTLDCADIALTRRNVSNRVGLFIDQLRRLLKKRTAATAKATATAWAEHEDEAEQKRLAKLADLRNNPDAWYAATGSLAQSLAVLELLAEGMGYDAETVEEFKQRWTCEADPQPVEAHDAA